MATVRFQPEQIAMFNFNNMDTFLFFHMDIHDIIPLLFPYTYNINNIEAHGVPKAQYSAIAISS